ncbi:Fungal transcriptional regulatory protein, N-terminal [Penicillium camemberti]|uniref:Fungal transcriptional regulatory protein, N-terminal n=1 Tax=Penicillium camemberti (strain FM 013) TaxID=1429867 RepID=A0A0G4P6Y5_PENC3|nr:Fungal transcriptional regulatory protein, N-terminal [Penicillium camemberti]
MNATLSTVKRRACVACTTAKAKCTPQAVNLCQRCARLGKSCTYLDLPQTKRKHKVARSRVEVLEKKVDQLTSQLAALTRQNGRSSPDTSNPLTNNLGSSRDPELDSTNIAALLEVAQDPSHGLDPPTSSILEGQPSIVDQGLLSEAEAERLVTTFQADLVSTFPFVLIANGETAARLRDREPFLFLCIVAATMGSAHPLRKIVAEEIMKHVTLRVVARSERNLELLRGLLVHIAWYSYPAERYHPQLLLLIQLCVSILYDLGLHRKSRSNLDEQRALLGTYWLSVGLCGTLGRPIIMKHDGRIDECIESIASTEHLSDRWIAPFIHLQSFLATVDEVYALMQPSGGSVLVQVTRGSLQRKFDSLRACVEKDISSCPSSTENAIRTEIKYVEMRLEELSLRGELWIAEPASAVRTTMLMGVIQRSKELIHMVRNLPVSEIAQMTISTSARICAAVGYMPTAVLTLLNLITDPTDSSMEAQVQAVVDAAEYPNVVIELASTLETRCEGMSAADKETDIVGSLCSKMRLLARCYPYQIRAIVGSAPSQDVTRDTSMMVVHANEVAVPPQVWPDGSTYGDLGDMFPVDDIQWDSLLSDFTGFS